MLNAIIDLLIKEKVFVNIQNAIISKRQSRLRKCEKKKVKEKNSRTRISRKIIKTVQN